MPAEKLLDPFIKLGNTIQAFLHLNKDRNETPVAENADQEILAAAFVASKINNGWFKPESIYQALEGVVNLLEEGKLNEWLGNDHQPATTSKRIGVIMSGNVPAVGFHDFLCVLVSGHAFIGKPSSDDKFLLPAFSKLLIDYEPSLKDKISFVERLENIDAVIATGSNNTSRYFEYYFGKYPHIIRKNRNSVAILRGDESKEELENLGNDIFQYFGLGCRNVSKLFVKKGFDLDAFFNAMFAHKEVINHNKYGNNYDYNRTVYLMSNTFLWDNGFMLLKEDIGLASPVGVVFFEYFEDEEQLKDRITMDGSNIQCVVGNREGEIPFGKAQKPELWDYADNVNTLEFLMKL